MSELEIQSNRQADAAQLIDDFELGGDAEFFADPSNRLEFLQSLDFDDFTSIAQHVNARVRGYEPRDKTNVRDKGSMLPMLRTPSIGDKSEALFRGFGALQHYMKESEDTPEQKLRGLGMATEALIIWVHPFDDGNGRTSRFLGKFIEDGTVDTDQLIAETADNNVRQRMYGARLRVDNTIDLNADILLDDDEIEQIKKEQQEVPIIEGIESSIQRLLEDKSLQDQVEAQADRWRNQRAEALEQR